MSKLMQVLQYCLSFFPEGVGWLLFFGFVLLVVVIGFKVIKLILDAIPFV